MLKLASITIMSTGNGPALLSWGQGRMPCGVLEPSISRKSALVVSAIRPNAFMNESFQFLSSILGIKVYSDVFGPSGNQVTHIDSYHSRGVITHRNLDTWF